jgi:hypothetical protein
MRLREFTHHVQVDSSHHVSEKERKKIAGGGKERKFLHSFEME